MTTSEGFRGSHEPVAPAGSCIATNHREPQRQRTRTIDHTGHQVELRESGLDLAIIYLAPPHRAADVERIASALRTV